MSLSTFFLRRRHPNPTQGHVRFVSGLVFDPGAEVFAPEQTVGDPLYNIRVYPQWNFFSFEVEQPPMVFQALSLPGYPQAGFPFAGIRSAALMHDSDYPDVEGDYFS